LKVLLAGGTAAREDVRINRFQNRTKSGNPKTDSKSAW
jgi:hypothetical protein